MYIVSKTSQYLHELHQARVSGDLEAFFCDVTKPFRLVLVFGNELTCDVAP